MQLKNMDQQATPNPANGLLDDNGKPLVSPNDVEIEMSDVNNSSKKLLKGNDSFEQPPEEESLSKRAGVATPIERRQPGAGDGATQNIEEEEKKA